MKRAPKHKRRQSGKRRIDVAATGQNRITVNKGRLTIQRHTSAGVVTQRDTLPPEIAESIGNQGECLDGFAFIARRSERVIVSVHAKHNRTLTYLAKRHTIKLAGVDIDSESGMISAEASGENLAEFLRHCAGHSECRSFQTWLAEIPEASTGTDSHHRYCIENGLSDMPKRIDYSAGRNAPKASYGIDGRYSHNDRDHTDTRNERKRAGEYAPRVAHTEH